MDEGVCCPWSILREGDRCAQRSAWSVGMLGSESARIGFESLWFSFHLILALFSKVSTIPALVSKPSRSELLSSTCIRTVYAHKVYLAHYFPPPPRVLT